MTKRTLAGLLLGSTAILAAAHAIAQDQPAPGTPAAEKGAPNAATRNSAAELTRSGATTSLSDVIVTVAPRQEVVARQRQYEAPNLVSIQPAEVIQQYPDFNAAEALGRMPGVSLSSDTGEGRFVNIRGIDGNLAGSTFGGVPLLNTFPGGTYNGGGGRAVEYDTIPVGSIDGLVVTYTPLPDHEAESLGGTIEMTPRTAANISKPFFDAQVGWGDEPEHGHTGPLDIQLAGGVRWGYNNGHLVVQGDGHEQADPDGFISNPTPFSLVLTASRMDDRRGFDDIEETYDNPGTDRQYDNIDLRRYNYHRRRFGYGGELDFKPNDDHQYFIRANIAGYTEAVGKNNLLYKFDAPNAVATANGGYLTDATPQISSTEEQETHRNQVYAVGGVDRWGDVVLDYRASYSRATYHQDYNYGATYKGATIPNFYYNNTANNGNYPVLEGDNALVNNPASYSPLTSVSNSTENDVDYEWAYAANLTVPSPFKSSDRIKFGAEVRLRTKDSTPYSYDSAITPLPFGTASTPAITNFYGQYTNGPEICLACVHDAYAMGAITSNGTLPDGQDQAATFHDKENIYAGYAEYIGEFGRFTYVAGVRVEATHAQYGAYSNNNPAMTYQFISQSENYINAFPSVQLRYQIEPNMLVRAVYSTGIGRPGFLQNTAATTSNFDVTQPAITQGNPNLKPTTGQDFDLDYEWYLPQGGIVQAGLFDKQFSNYIVTENQFRIYSGSYAPFQGLTTLYTTFANRSGAYARGVQLSYRQKFLFLPGVFNGFGVEANATFVDSRIEEYDAATSGTGHAEYGLLPGTSHTTLNMSGFYEKYGLQFRIAAEYVSASLFSLGGSKATDTIEDDRLTLDWTSAYQVTQNVSIYFNVKNITNTPLRFYQYNSSYPIQREYYEQTYEGGVRIRF
ncbi:MAG TPA: TonB-dependent receptor [Caulobacteraceae bacterium]|jgi:TonB-dependent receptor|nr:TonB-dependent receptor [Caulobacteraceae bacterium]